MGWGICASVSQVGSGGGLGREDSSISGTLRISVTKHKEACQVKNAFGLKWAVVMAGAMLLVLAAACGEEVVKEVPVDRIVEKEVVKEVVKEVPVEVVKEVEVIKEVVKEVEVVVVATPVPVGQPAAKGTPVGAWRGAAARLAVAPLRRSPDRTSQCAGRRGRR